MFICIGKPQGSAPGAWPAPSDLARGAESHHDEAAYAIAHGAMIGAVVGSHHRGMSVERAVTELAAALSAATWEGEWGLAEAIRGASDGAADGVSLIGGDARRARRWVLAILHGEKPTRGRRRDGQGPRRDDGGKVSVWRWIGRTPSAPMSKAQSRRTT